MMFRPAEFATNSELIIVARRVIDPRKPNQYPNQALSNNRRFPWCSHDNRTHIIKKIRHARLTSAISQIKIRISEAVLRRREYCTEGNLMGPQSYLPRTRT
jgi:hypothetical protein